MDPIEEIEEQLRRREQAIEARELKTRLKEIEQDLDQVPVTPTSRHKEKAESQGLSEKISNIGKFILIVFSVIIAIQISAWVGRAIIFMGVVWVAYKLFLDKK